MNVGLIPTPDYKEKIYHDKGNTDDIIHVVLKGCSADIKNGFKEFCKGFSKDENGLRELWSFIKYRIVYKVDDDGRQDILLPAALWDRGWGDCKSKTVFTIHVLRCLGIPYQVRFTGYSGKSLTQVYALAYIDGEEYIIDTVFDFFNREKKYKHKKDFDMTKISMISGFEKQRENELANKVGNTTNGFNYSTLLILGIIGVVGYFLMKKSKK